MESPQLAIVLVLIAAFLHALANALIKASVDPLLTRGFMSAVSAAMVLPFLIVIPRPIGDAWIILLVSAAVHGCYPFLVAASYRRSDLSVAFPIARGIAPIGLLLIVAVFDTGGVTLVQFIGVAIITGGILTLCLPRAAFISATRSAGLSYAVATGAVVAIYTYLDAQGLRAAESSLSYIAWLVVVDGAISTSAVASVRHRHIASFVKDHWRISSAAALLGLLNFSMALYALGLGEIVEIGALRETSIVFAAFLGARFLGEGYALRRLAAALIVAAGVAIMQLFR